MIAFQAQDQIIPQLLERGLTTQEDVERAENLAQADSDHRGALYHLVKLRGARPSDVQPLLADLFKVDLPAEDELDIDEAILAMFDRSTIVRYGILPLADDGETLRLLMADPSDWNAIEDIRFQTTRQIQPLVLDGYTLSSLIELHYVTLPDAPTEAPIDRLVEEFGGEGGEAVDMMDALRDETIENAAVVQTIAAILGEAIRQGASDIHFETYENGGRVRYRIDGVLVVRHQLPGRGMAPLMQRVKIMSGLDIAQTRLPQDGRIQFMAAPGKQIDFRVSTVPARSGEKIVLRILDRTKVVLDMKELGFSPTERDLLATQLESPHGMIMLTGPTGSGKTTTLYAMLSVLNRPETNIMTLEDPVEYTLPGINQIAVRPDIDLTWARTLKAFLRQDPDVIMVGEMRDRETAETGIQAAMTGHLILTTLHTNDAASAITRLADLGPDRFQIASAVRLIIAQRLVRRVCSQCRGEMQPSASQLSRLGLTAQEASQIRFLQGRGCSACNNGYKGRIGIYEILPITPEIEELIYTNASDRAVTQRAKLAGMKTLREAGVDRIRQGVTTVEEVLRHT